MATDTPPRVASSTATSPSFVGRGEEVRRLEAALANALGGRGSAVFLSGETGIGKTRLAQEALLAARKRGFLVLEGQAYPLEGGLAYAPLLDAFGPFLRRLDPARQARLTTGLADLVRLFGGLRLPPPEPLGDPALEKTRLFEAVARLLERMSVEQPVTLLLDDLHWADPASVELLHYLARGLAGQRVLLLGTYRAGEVDAARGLRALLTSLRRARLCEELSVSRLSAKDVAALACVVLGGEVSAALVELLEARAGGTPLFIEALIRALLEAGEIVPSAEGWTLRSGGVVRLPPDVRDLILERLDRLGAAERRVIELLAVGGEAVAHALLRATSELADEQLLAALERLRTAGLVVEAVAGREVGYTLGHPLVQEVAYGALPEMARRRAHAAFAATLERICPEDLDRLARHFQAAGTEVESTRALAVLLAAGARARAIYANEEAARHFGAALGLLREGHRPPAGSGYPAPLLPWLLERLGEVWARLGEGGAAVAIWSEALAAREGTDDAAAVARLRHLLAGAEWDRGHFAAAEGHLAAGLAALAGREPGQELVDLYTMRWTVLDRRGNAAGVVALADEFFALAEQLGSPAARSVAQRLASTVFLWQRDVAAARQCALRALAAAEEANDPILICNGHDAVFLASSWAGDHRVARRHAECALTLARHVGAPTLELRPHFRLAIADILSGAWADALQRSAEGLALARRLGQPRAESFLLSARALVLALRGESAAAEECLTAGRVAYGGGIPADRHVFALAAMASALLALGRGETTQALALAAASFNAPSDSASASPLSTLPPTVLAIVAEAHVAAGDPGAALATAGELAAFGPDAPYAVALAAYAEGLARRALGESEAALACFGRSMGGFAAAELPFEEARARLDWSAGVAPALPAAAAAAAQRSLDTFERLGARRYAARARRLLQGLGVAPRLAHRRVEGGSLSAREIEVARLVAEGLTNAEIAARLFLSPRTVTTHLERIYARLGITSRAALARYVTESHPRQSTHHNT